MDLKNKQSKGSNTTPNARDLVQSIIRNIGFIDDRDLSSLTVDKYDTLLSLISCNIKLSANHNNFDTNEFRIDKSTVFNYKMKYTTTGNVSNTDISGLNKFYQKHRNIAKMLIDN